MNDLHFWLTFSDLYSCHCLLLPRRAADRARVDQQCVFDPLDVCTMRVAKDDDVCFWIHSRQPASGEPVEITVVDQPHPLGEYSRSLDKATQCSWQMTVNEDDSLPGQLQLDHGGQLRAAPREILDVNVATHGVHRRDAPQWRERTWVVYVTGVQDQVYSSQSVKHRLRQLTQAMRDVGVGEQADGERRHLFGV